MAKGKKKKKKRTAQAAASDGAVQAVTSDEASTSEAQPNLDPQVVGGSSTEHVSNGSASEVNGHADAGAQSASGDQVEPSALEKRMEELIEQVEAAEASAERVKLLKELGALSRDEAEDPEGALEAYVLAFCEAPTDAEIVRAVEELATEMGSWANVVQGAWEEASEAPAESVDLLLQLAEWYENRLDSDEGARQCYALLVDAVPDDSEVRRAHLRLLEKLGDWQAVLDATDAELEKASQQRANSIRPRAAEIALFELGDLDEAERRIEALDASSEAAHRLRRRLLEKRSDWQGVLTLLEEQVEQAEGDAKAELYAEIGALQEDALENREAAKDSYKRALALSADHADAKAGLARIEAHYQGLGGDERLGYINKELQAAKDAGEWSEAIRLQKELVELQPGTEQETALDELLAEAGEFKELEERAMAKYEQADSLLKKASIKHALAERFRKAQMREQTIDEVRMWALYEEAFALDPKHALRAKRLGDRALENGDQVGALRYYEAAVREADQLPRDEASGAALAAADIARALGRKEKEQTLLVKALVYLGDDADTMLRLADLSYDIGEIDEAGEYYGGWMKTGQDPVVMTRARTRRAEALIRQGDGVGGLVLLQKLSEEDRNEATGELRAKALEAAQRWGQAVDAWKETAALSDSDEKRCERLLHAAQICFTKNKDAAAAESLIRQADPELKQRAARTQLMAVLARTEKWEALHELLARQAELAASDHERAQFEKTAGFIAMEKLENTELAQAHFERSLAAIAEQGDVKTALESLRPPERLQQLAQTESERAAAGETYAKVPKAPAAPDLSEMGLEEAVSTAEHQKLRKIEVAMPEAADKVVQSAAMEQAQAAVQSVPEPEAQPEAKPEPVYALPPRGKTALSTSRFLDEDLWQEHIVHEEQDVFLTMLFAVITPAVMAERQRQLSEYGIDPASERDPEHDPSAIAQTLHYVASLAHLPLPKLYSKPGSTGGLEFLHTIPPAMGVGKGAEAGGPGQALAFVAARTLSYYRPGHYLRELMSSGSDLRAWLIASIRLSKPGFAAPAELEDNVEVAQRALASHLPDNSKKVLAELCSKLLEHAPSLDLKRWVAAIDLTADRIGFIVSDDLEMATALIEASPSHASVVGTQERIDALNAYAKSHRYHMLRQELELPAS